MRLGIKVLYISISIIQIVFLIVSTEAQADISLVKLVTIVPGGGPKDLTNVNGTLFFTADDGIHGRELWKSDGTEAGTVMVKDINPLTGSDPQYLTNVNGTLYFNAGHSGYGGGGLSEELWKSDGTETGTVMVKDLNAANPSYPNYLTNVNGTLFFTAYDFGDNELWKSDGTEAGTVMVKNIHNDSDSFPNKLTNVNGTLYFTAVDGDHHGRELWKSDGTEAGTVMVKDINLQPWPNYNSFPDRLTAVGNMLFFTADDGIHGRELWKSDGTEAGTVIVEDIWGLASGSDPTWLTHFRFIVAFSADDGANGRELWGSTLGFGAYLIKDIRTLPGQPEYSSNPEFLTAVGGTLFFAATAADGTARELWKSDGTEAGTVMVKDINPISDSSPQNLADVNGTLYFSADDGEHGPELWKSDGTSVGTVIAKDINTSPSTGSNPGGFTDVNGTFYFVANARELWKIDENEESFPWELFVPAFTKKQMR